MAPTPPDRNAKIVQPPDPDALPEAVDFQATMAEIDPRMVNEPQILEAITKIRATIAQADTAAEHGITSDLSGLDGLIDHICRAATAQPDESARRIATQLERLGLDLDRLVTRYGETRSSLQGQLQGQSRRTHAIAAYRNRG